LGESAGILKKFNLGEGALYPTRHWHPDRETRVQGKFYYLSQGNRKAAFLIERSPEVETFAADRWTLPPIPSDDQLVFSDSVLAGPDIWWDKSIASYFFISSRIVQALRAESLAEDWHLLRCPVVEQG